MRLASLSVGPVTAVAGSAYLSAILVLVVSRTPLGSPLFFSLAAVGFAAYAVVLARVLRGVAGPRRVLWVAIVFAMAFRIPPALAPVGPDSDMVRYQWDGRVQRLGLNPYRVIPADPALAWTHTPDTLRMPSRRARTPYPPAAQLFFRLIVTLRDSVLAIKLALVLCDLLTGVVLWRWLRDTGRSEWLVLAYAWNPLVVFEVAHSGHVDALGALWIVLSAWCLSRRRTLLASLAFVLAILTKLLPVVLAPLFVGRVRPRDLAAAAALLLALTLPFAETWDTPLAAVTNVVDYIRFNGPIFTGVAAWTSPRAAAATAVALGAVVALWARIRRDANDPVAWAWPMAAALACAPVIYPWYLLYLTPFLFVPATLPLVGWTFSVFPIYIVWHLSRHGGRWIPPWPVVVFEFGVLGAMILWEVCCRRARDPRA